MLSLCCFVHYLPISTADTVKIALNVVKVSKLVQMKLITYRSKLALGAFRKFSALVLTPIWLPQTKGFHCEEEIFVKVFT